MGRLPYSVTAGILEQGPYWAPFLTQNDYKYSIFFFVTTLEIVEAAMWSVSKTFQVAFIGNMVWLLW